MKAVKYLAIAMVGIAITFAGIALLPTAGDGSPYNAILFWGGALIVVVAIAGLLRGRRI